MECTEDRVAGSRSVSLVDFVSAAKASRPEAWKCVERLKLACVLVERFPEWTPHTEAVRGPVVHHA